MFNDSFLVIKKSFVDYKGPYSMYLAIWLLAMLYIYLTEENKKIKTFFLGYSLTVIFVIICNPIIYKLLGSILTIDTYWRLFWILPVGIVIAYAAVKLIFSIQEKNKKIVTILTIFITIIASGSCVYKYFDISKVKEFDYLNYNFAKVNNLYKIPDEAFEISKIISEHDSENKKVMAPEEIVPYIRQYDACIHLVYGRNPWGYEDNENLKMLYAGNIKDLIPKLDELNSNYIIFRKETELNDDISKYSYELIDETENYNIYYKNTI